MAGPRPKSLPSRSDPARRRNFTGFDQTRLLRPDPSKKYKFVDPSDRLNGVGMHEQRGWVIEKMSRDGVGLEYGVTARNAGDPQTLMDHVLMSVDRAEWERVEREGFNGERGQQLLDDIDDQITNAAGGSPDGGIRSRYATTVNETKPLQEFDSAL